MKRSACGKAHKSAHGEAHRRLCRIVSRARQAALRESVAVCAIGFGTGAAGIRAVAAGTRAVAVGIRAVAAGSVVVSRAAIPASRLRNVGTRELKIPWPCREGHATRIRRAQKSRDLGRESRDAGHRGQKRYGCNAQSQKGSSGDAADRWLVGGLLHGSLCSAVACVQLVYNSIHIY